MLFYYFSVLLLQAYFPDGFPWYKLVSGSADGAGANTSERVGFNRVFRALVDTRMTPEQRKRHPGWLPTQHCSAHKLGLIVKRGFLSVAYIRIIFEPVLVDLCLWFRNSSVKFIGLQQICSLLCGIEIESAVDAPAVTRWLTHDKSVSAVREIMPFIIKDLTAYGQAKNHKAEDKARAAGLLHQVNSFDFWATIYLLSDILPVLSVFSKTMQKLSCELSGVLQAYRHCKDTLILFR